MSRVYFHAELSFAFEPEPQYTDEPKHTGGPGVLDSEGGANRPRGRLQKGWTRKEACDRP